jgi:hypothetical protein
MRENRKHCHSPVDEWSAVFFLDWKGCTAFMYLLRVYLRTYGTTKMTVQCIKKLVELCVSGLSLLWMYVCP